MSNEPNLLFFFSHPLKTSAIHGEAVPCAHICALAARGRHATQCHPSLSCLLPLNTASPRHQLAPRHATGCQQPTAAGIQINAAIQRRRYSRLPSRASLTLSSKVCRTCGLLQPLVRDARERVRHKHREQNAATKSAFSFFFSFSVVAGVPPTVRYALGSFIIPRRWPQWHREPRLPQINGGSRVVIVNVMSGPPDRGWYYGVLCLSSSPKQQLPPLLTRRAA